MSTCTFTFIYIWVIGTKAIQVRLLLKKRSMSCLSMPWIYVWCRLNWILIGEKAIIFQSFRIHNNWLGFFICEFVICEFFAIPFVVGGGCGIYSPMKSEQQILWMDKSHRWSMAVNISVLKVHGWKEGKRRINHKTFEPFNEWCNKVIRIHTHSLKLFINLFTTRKYEMWNEFHSTAGQKRKLYYLFLWIMIQWKWSSFELKIIALDFITNNQNGERLQKVVVKITNQHKNGI